MSSFFNKSFDDMEEDYDGDENQWNENQWNENPGPPMFRNNRRPRYGDAYGDYRGGYGPGGGFGPRPLMPPPPPFRPPMPPPRGFMWGRGFGPGGPPRKSFEDERAIKYLIRCGVVKENLRNLSHDLLRLIQPEYCGLCDFSFDTFATSRMHYISKNHLKNQKKWQTKTQGGYHNEVPMKARNLYCELCDIQITSKVHGDAHYDGKPHRAIVEGRKKPKNPLLLQSGMQYRLDQLIRREKRCLKPINDKPEGKEETGKELKVASPELYCDICKTTVTCSEQMTMHMNGKKHLAKEKHYILTMMKGNTEEDYYEEEEEEEEEEAEAEASEYPAEEGEGGDAAPSEDAKHEENASGDDWGNEAWENQDQTEETAEKA